MISVGFGEAAIAVAQAAAAVSAGRAAGLRPGIVAALAADFAAATNLHRGPGCPVVVTGGAAGAIVAHDGSAAHVAAPELEAVRDTVGTGDEFVGVLAARLAGGGSLVDAATASRRGLRTSCGGTVNRRPESAAREQVSGTHLSVTML